MELGQKPAKPADGTPAFKVQLAATKNGGPADTLDADAVTATCLYYDNPSQNYKPVQSAHVTFSGPESLFFFPSQGKTDQNGQLVSTVSCDYPGEYDVKADAVGGTPHMTYTPSESITIEFTEKPDDEYALRLELILSAAPPGLPIMNYLEAYCYMGTTIPGMPKDPVPGAQVSFACADANLVFCSPSSTTGADGRCATYFGVYVDGAYTVTAICSAGDFGTARGQLQATLQVAYKIDLDYQYVQAPKWPDYQLELLVSATLRILPDKPVANEYMELGTDAPAKITPDYGRTDASGTFSGLLTCIKGDFDSTLINIHATAGSPLPGQSIASSFMTYPPRPSLTDPDDDHRAQQYFPER